MSLQAIYEMVKSTVLGFIEDEALTRGAAISFYTVTAIAPLLLILVGLAGFFLAAKQSRAPSLHNLAD